MADTPRLDTVTPASARPSGQLTLAGTAFGQKTAASAVRFRLPVSGAAPVVGAIVDWAATTIHVGVPGLASFIVQVPSLASLGGAGPRSLAVRTPWGRSEPVAFLLGELPQITAVLPPSPSPGAMITVVGRAFGPLPGSLELKDPSEPANG